MASSNLDIANKALRKLGQRKITSLTQAGSEQAAIINDVFVDILKEVLSEYPWSFAQKRVVLDYVVPDDVSRTIDDSVYTPVTITGATAANPVVITAASHGLIDGDWIKISSVVGMTQLNGNFYIVANATTNTFSLTTTAGVAVNGLAYTAYTSGGSIQKAFDLPMTEDGSIVVYEKPSDYVKITRKSIQNALINVEGDRILSNVTGLKIKYTYYNTTVSSYFPQFIEALSSRLAGEIAFAVTNSVKKASDLIEIYRGIDLPNACSIDSTQSSPDEGSQDEWLNAQLMGSNFPATTGETWHPV